MRIRSRWFGCVRTALDTEPQIAPELLVLLRCPETGEPLAPAPPHVVKELEARRLAGTLRDRTQNEVKFSITGGLCAEGGVLFYPVRDGIPILLIAEAIPLS